MKRNHSLQQGARYSSHCKAKIFHYQLIKIELVICRTHPDIQADNRSASPTGNTLKNAIYPVLSVFYTSVQPYPSHSDYRYPEQIFPPFHTSRFSPVPHAP